MKDTESRTPLHFACGFAHDEIARLLIESGANVEATDSKGNTPLHYAAGYGEGREGLSACVLYILPALP